MISRHFRSFSSTIQLSRKKISPLRHYDFSVEEENHGRNLISAVRYNFGDITNGCIIEYKNNINCFYYEYFKFGKNYVLEKNIHNIILLENTKIFLKSDNNNTSYDVQGIYPYNLFDDESILEVQYIPYGII